MISRRDGCAAPVPRTLRLKVRAESYPWLNKAAIEVNQVWNWANETSAKAAQPFAGPGKWLSDFDLNNLSAGATQCFERIGADTIQRVNGEYVVKRRAAKRCKLRWRVSRGARRSLGWIPFKAANLKRKCKALRFCGKTFRVFESERLDGVEWQQGCFAQDALGDWWLCLPVQRAVEHKPAEREAVGIDLGLKDTAVTSDGERLEAGRFYRGIEAKIAQAQRRGHKKHAKRLHRQAANRRRDALHKFSTALARQYQRIYVGDVSSVRLAKSCMAKAVLDCGWGMLRAQLEYKCQQAAREFAVVSEKYTSVTCSACGSLSGPRGVNGLIVRSWICGDCGESHDRDVNSARLIRLRGEVSPSVRGNESLQLRHPPSSAVSRSRGGAEAAKAAA